MSIFTCQVLATIVDLTGSPIPGVVITATISGVVSFGGYIENASEVVVTDNNGLATLLLPPNSTGTPTNSTYTFQIDFPTNKPSVVFYDIAVPNQASITLGELLGFAAGGLIVWDDSLIWKDSLNWVES